jgi:hypothetical protein
VLLLGPLENELGVERLKDELLALWELEEEVEVWTVDNALEDCTLDDELVEVWTLDEELGPSKELLVACPFDDDIANVELLDDCNIEVELVVKDEDLVAWALDVVVPGEVVSRVDDGLSDDEAALSEVEMPLVKTELVALSDGLDDAELEPIVIEVLLGLVPLEEI